MKPRSLPFRLTALAITVSMLTSPGMAVMPTVWQIGGPPCYGYGYPRPYLYMGPLPPLPLPRWYAPPVPWTQPVPYTVSYAPYNSGACCDAPVSYVGGTACSGCATGCSTCSNGCSAFSAYSGGAAACCGGVSVQPASSKKTIEPEADPDADSKYRGSGDQSGFESNPDTGTTDGFSGAGGVSKPEGAAPGTGDPDDSGGAFRDLEFGNEPSTDAPFRSGIPRPSDAGLGGGGVDGAAPAGGTESPTPDDDGDRGFRRRIPETMPEFGDPTDGGEAPMFETGQTNGSVTHSTSRPPTTPLPEADTGTDEGASDTEKSSAADDDGTTFLPPVLNDSEDRAAPDEGSTTDSASGESPSTPQATARPVTEPNGNEDPANDATDQENPSSDESSQPKTDESTSEENDASTRSPDLRTSFRIPSVILPESRSGANSLLGPRRLASSHGSARTATVATTPRPASDLKTSDSHPSAPRQPIRWISLPLDESRSLR